MPTYTINGKKVRTDRELTDAEIDEIAADLGGAQRPVTGVAAIPGYDRPVPAATEAPPSASERMTRNLISGAAAVPVLGTVGKLFQMAPATSAAGRTTQAIGRAITPTGPADLARQTAISGAASVGAGEFGQAVAAKAGEEYRLPAEIGSGLVLGLGANTLLNPLELTAQGLMNRAAGREFFDFTNQAANTFGQARATSRLQGAMQANPDLAADLARASEIEQRTGVKLPIPAASKGDTTLEGLLASQTSRAENAAFTAAIKQQEKDALAAVQEAQKRLAGDPRNAALVAEVEARKVALENARRETAASMKQANIERQLTDIDSRIKDITAESIIAGAGKKEDIGTRIRNLLSARETIVRQEFKPLYEQVLGDATKAGVQMESPVVANLWNFVKQRQAEDVFAKFPALDSTIKKVLAPQKAPVSGRFAEKYPQLVQSAEGTFKPLDVNGIDSLKRAINKAIGQTKDDDQLRMLYELKSRFDDSLTSLPEDFVTAYKGLDKQYADRLGIPFSEKGVLSVERAKFVESTVPYLTEKPSALRQILVASDNSPEAYKLAEEAFLMKISETPGIINKETLSVNPAALQAFMRKNAESIDQVPGLRQRLEQTASSIDGLLGNRQRLLELQKNAAVQKIENVWSRAYGQTGGFEGFVGRALNNPEELKQLLVAAGSDSTLQRGLKSTVLDLGLKSSDKMRFFDDNLTAINTLFGKDHAQNIKALLEASDRLASNPVMARINQSLSQTTQFEQITGTDPVRTASLLRQQVQSTFYKVSTLFSRFLQNRSAKAENIEIQEFLLNPKNVRDMAQALKALEEGGEKGLSKARQIAGKLLSNAGTAALIGATAPARIIEREEVPQE